MQAIILAAGMGKRLGELTKGNTKCMVTVNGISLIDRLLTQLCSVNLARVVIVVGYEGEKLQEYIGKRYDTKLKIEYINNPIYQQTNNIYSLALAKRKLVEDDTLLIESDLIFDDSLFSMILDDSNPNVALVDKYEAWMDGTMVHIKKGDIIDVGYIAGCLLGGMNKYQIADYRNFTAFTTILQLRNDKTRREIIVKI